MLSTLLFAFVGCYVSLKFLGWFLSIGSGKPKRIPKPDISLRFAAVIPAHNEEESIAGTVQSILDAGIPPEDVYVLLNGCTDKTAEEVKKCRVKICGEHRHVEPVTETNHIRGKEETIKFAIHGLGLFWKYTHVCFFDADTLIDREYFRVTKERIRSDPSIDIVCGRPRSLPQNWLTAHRAVQYSTFHRLHKSAQEKFSGILVVPGCAGTYSTRSLRKIDWSSDTRIGDMDATIQANNMKMKIAFEPRAIVKTQDPSTLRGYTNQLYWRWNRGLWMNMRKHGVLWKGPLSMMNWDCRWMFFDQFLPFIFLIAVWQLRLPYHFWSAIGGYSAIIAVEVLVCAIAEKRWDILKYFPVFPLLRIYDTLLFVSSMWNILLKKEKKAAWISPQRYQVKA